MMVFVGNVDDMSLSLPTFHSVLAKNKKPDMNGRFDRIGSHSHVLSAWIGKMSLSGGLHVSSWSGKID